MIFYKLEWYFRKVTFILEVENNAAKGVEHFVNTYFDRGEVFKPGLTEEEQVAIINQFFKWRIGCFVAC
jgi:hypothetical protein